MTDLAKLAANAKDSAEPIKRTVNRDSKPNPVLPILEDSWEKRSKRDGSESETGATKLIRTYNPDDTLALVRALRRASDSLEVGVRIDAPQTETDVPVYVKSDDGSDATDEDGNKIQETNEDGTPKTRKKITYRAGNVLFEAVTRQKRTRKDKGDQASTDAPEREGDSDDADADDDSGTDDVYGDNPQHESPDVPEGQPEPAWS